MKIRLMLFWLIIGAANSFCNFSTEDQIFIQNFEESASKKILRMETNGLVYCYNYAGQDFSIKVIDFMLGSSGIEKKLVHFTKIWNLSVPSEQKIDDEFSIQAISDVGRLIKCLEITADLTSIKRLEDLKCNLNVSKDPKLSKLFAAFLLSLLNEVNSAQDELRLFDFLSKRSNFDPSSIPLGRKPVYQKKVEEALQREQSMLSYKLVFCAKQTPLRYLLVSEGCGEVIYSDSIFKRISRTTLDQRILLYLEMARALYYMHRYKIAHCNIKPESFLIRQTPNSYVTLGDLSFASSGYACTESNIQYMAPEIAAMRGKAQLAHDKILKSDIYSLGLAIADIERDIKQCSAVKPSSFNYIMALNNNFEDQYDVMMRWIGNCFDCSWDIKTSLSYPRKKFDLLKGVIMSRYKAIIGHMLSKDPLKRPSIEIVLAKLYSLYILFEHGPSSLLVLKDLMNKINAMIEEKGIDFFVMVPFDQLQKMSRVALDLEL